MDNHDNVFKNNNPVFGSRNLLAHSGEGTVLQEFYRGAHVFVTGGTGFMGKVLVEKLLRSCPDVARISLLVRAKKGRSVEDRIDDLLASPCFSELMLQSPKLKSKLAAISGDIGAEDLGISDADRRLLSDVDVVFHLAATVRFDEQLKVAVNRNVKGTCEVLALCRTFNKLKAMIYVSTAFSHCPLKTIEERIYDPPIPSKDALIMAETLDNDLMIAMTPSLLGKWPNTYGFSKAIAEDAVRSHEKDLPVGVFRPAIVVCSLNEPVPGWTDNLFGPMGLCLGMGSGVVRVLQSSPEVSFNIVPCDMTINCLIASAWDVAENRSRREVRVYNFCVPKENDHSLGEAYSCLMENATARPMLKSMWYMGVVFTKNAVLATILRVFLHLLPALLLDLISIVSFKKTQMLKMYSSVHKVSDAYVFFNTRSWVFEVNNVKEMWMKLPRSDQSMFDFDLQSLDWRAFHAVAWNGMRTFLAKESPDTIPAARIRTRKLYWLHRLTQLALAFLLVYTIWTSMCAFIQIGC